MDTLALGIIAIGIVAAIGVVLVAMTGSGTETTAAQAPTEPAPVQKETRPRPRARRRPQSQPAPAFTPAMHRRNGYATGSDPLVDGFMRVVSGELEQLRLQQQKIDQRLQLINGIAELMHDMQSSSASSNGHDRTAARS